MSKNTANDKLTDRQVQNLIDWAMSPSDEEIAQFIKEFDEGKHPLSDADKDALSTSGFRQYLKACNKIASLTKQVEELKAELKAKQDRVNELEAMLEQYGER
jgi:peptidoglycan hydrolase CwlO-like protein